MENTGKFRLLETMGEKWKKQEILGEVAKNIAKERRKGSKKAGNMGKTEIFIKL